MLMVMLNELNTHSYKYVLLLGWFVLLAQCFVGKLVKEKISRQKI